MVFPDHKRVSWSQVPWFDEEYGIFDSLIGEEVIVDIIVEETTLPEKILGLTCWEYSATAEGTFILGGTWEEESAFRGEWLAPGIRL